ncbi:hypothetical protein HMPREF1545_03139 [Oscillibacter sp. KLE 1728]|nr:hypothetical protein HMPREF1545_03139 [Oscillibacter sp. KLE 1728]
MKFTNCSEPAAIRQKRSRSDKSSYLQGMQGGCMIIPEAFQYPTRLGRAA